jgi:glycosyltransferase involved in cell wall biosynthesis
VIVLTHSFKLDLVCRGIDPEKVFVVTNGIEVEKFQRPEDISEARADIGVPQDKFLVGYIGTTGMAHGLETILEAAYLCRNDDHIRFLIMGEGSERARLERKATEMQLSNLIFKSFVPHDRVISYLSALDTSIVHLKPDPVFKTVIPSKIFEAMALGVPIIHAVEGESAEIIEAAGAGICVPSGNAQSIADGARRLSQSPEELLRMTAAGQQAARSQYDRRILAAKITDVLGSIAEAGKIGVGANK